jgi:menaquinone-dependent protoporphyrinogen oxidase
MTDSLVAAPLSSAGVRPARRPRTQAGSCFGPVGRGPRVLVAFATRHGATREIAAELARWLPTTDAGRHVGMWTVLAPVQERLDRTAFDAVVLGSPLYDGCWLPTARRYATDAANTLYRRPVWLFSSGVNGPATERPAARAATSELTRWAGDLDVRGHRVLPGRLESRLLSAGERVALSGDAVAEGDFRDWHAVREWAVEIATEVAGSALVGSH